MIYFLSSIPRSGSTLLASLLGQRPDTYVSITSNLSDILGSVLLAVEDHPTATVSKDDEEKFRILNSIVESKYSDRSESFIFDKGRAWSHPDIMENMRTAQGSPSRVIATVRPIAECVVSFYLIDRANENITVEDWIKTTHGKR